MRFLKIFLHNSNLCSLFIHMLKYFVYVFNFAEIIPYAKYSAVSLTPAESELFFIMTS